MADFAGLVRKFMARHAPSREEVQNSRWLLNRSATGPQTQELLGKEIHEIKPIVFERGKDVQTRRRDLAAINKDQVVNPESNYCFGEGGAGTYSDGKLYTRSKKRGDIRSVLETFVAHGARLHARAAHVNGDGRPPAVHA